MQVQLLDKVLVDSAPKRIRTWGNWQFPSLGRHNEKLYYRFHDAPDHYDSYGSPGLIYQSDIPGTYWQGCTDLEGYHESRAIRLPSGDLIRRCQRDSARIETLELPQPVGEFTINNRHYTCYANHQLPPELGGISLLRKKTGEEQWKVEHATMEEPGGIRCGFDGFLPGMQARGAKLWLGPDQRLYLLVYNFQLDDKGKPDPYDRVYLMVSDDEGRSFYQIGLIPYQPDLVEDPGAYAPGRRGFLEPEICFFDEKNLLCVMRTTHRDLGPMYATRSSDGGKTWSKPKVIFNHGVLPKLLYLDCGALVLSFGRPGVDIMVSTDKGISWGAPIAIVPQRNYNVAADSCGYTNLLAIDRQTCMLAYSDFNYDPGDGYPRKALFSRLIRIS